MSERRPHLILVGLIALALVGALLLTVPGSPLYQKPVLGLDLQGGLEVILQAVPPENRPLRESDLDRSLDIIRNRVDKLGLTEPEVTKQGSNQIAASLPGVDNPRRVRDLIGSTAKLELYDLQTALTGPSIDVQGFPVATPQLYDLLSDSRTQSLAQEGKPGPFYLFRRQGKALVAGPLRTRDALLATEVAQRAQAGKEGVPKGYRIFGVPANRVIITCGVSAGLCPGANDATRTSYYLFRFNPEAPEPVPEMTGADLRLNGTRADFDTQTGRPIVLMQFTDDGADKFQSITREEAIRGQLLYNRLGQGGDRDPFNQNFAIVLDREIQSYPSIDFQQYPNGISGDTGAQITGDFSVDEAKDLALVLQTGALPVEFRTLSETQISATLGEDSLRQALIAAIAGLLVVALFLLVFYRFLGLVAVIGLAIYAVFLYAMILVFDVTLTLPGFAGMILTIGVAADANVVVFERIKEESRSGKSVRASIAAGYGKGFNTIIDANVVTAITALVLFALAAAGVRGFALMLLIGTAISLLTAVFATRAMLGLLAGFRWFDSPRFMGAQGQQTATWLQIDYMGKRRLWFAISGVVLAVSIGSIALKGLNLGIDFDGGTKISFATPQPVALEDVRDEARRIGQGNAILQGVGESRNDEYRQFQLRTGTLAPGELARLQGGLRERLGVDAQAESFSVNTVSASFGRQIAESAVYAILISLLLVVLYITFRFQWKFAVATIVALLHDVLIAVGIYSLLDREVTTATVAAILTVLGYSIYDTIIILDRVRENLPLMRRASFATIGNVSLWETIRRSLATTFITLLPVAALYLFGGDTLRDFAFALLVGIGFGAYSSIFIAAPLVGVLKEREPEYARRRDDPELARDGGTPLIEAATEAAADEPVPELAPLTPSERAVTNDAKRERRRQRRKARPHGRAR